MPLLRPSRARNLHLTPPHAPTTSLLPSLLLLPSRTATPTKSRNNINRRSLASSSSNPPNDDANEHPAHESHYDPPSGWLFGVPPGQKYQKEGWENTWVYGFWGSLVVGAVAYAYKPDTSIQTWALEEARRRLEAEGILEDPSPEKK